MAKPSPGKLGDKFMQQIMRYYEERAQEYDEIYLGKGPAIPGTIAYKNDGARIKEMVSVFGTGHLIDIGCGTGFWLPYYAQNCSQITLLDQSAKMLSECKRRVDKLGFKEKCYFVQEDFFKVHFANHSFESAFVGFFISHLFLELEQLFFAKLKKILKPNAQFMIIDSAWSKLRQRYRKKEGIQKRELYNGRTFTIFKRYFTQSDVQQMFERQGIKLESFYMGDVFFAGKGQKIRDENTN